MYRWKDCWCKILRRIRITRWYVLRFRHHILDTHNYTEAVLCKREPNNQVRATPSGLVLLNISNLLQYDSNAIRVDNVLGHQIGHIPRNVASKVAPYVVWQTIAHVEQPLSDTKLRIAAISSSRPSSRAKRLSMIVQLSSSSMGLATRRSAPGSRNCSKRIS